MFMYKDGNTYHILSNSNNTIIDVLSFSYTNCVWSGTSGSTFSNQGRYLYWTSNNAVWTANATGDNLTINGYKIYNTYRGNNYYIRYNNSSWISSTTNSQNEVVYAISGPTTASWPTPLSITGNQTTFSDLGSFTYSANAAFRPAYYTLIGNGTYYVLEGGSPSNTIPASSSTGLIYSWSLNDGTNDDGHVRIDSSTGEVTYYNSYSSSTNTTIKVTAMHTASGASSSATKTITFNSTLPIANPISITATDKTILQGETWTADNYTLTATDGYQAYQFVIAESSNTSVATVANSTGGFTVTGIETGTATITISAYKQGNTEIACSTTFIVTVSKPETGVSGGIVTLFDYEDHNWSYYQPSGNLPFGYPTEYLSSPDPRNVKITYRGGGVTNGTAVAISALDGEGQNTMIYYKTLEKTVPGMTGDYPYTVISNPFSKRPATGNGNNKTYYGFAGWKIISGGEYISEYNNHATLPLDATIHFTNLETNYSPNCTSGEVVFEATWVQATVKTSSTAQTFDGGTYETNFWVLSGNPSAAVTVPGNCTMTARYPDGTTSWTGNFSRAITAGGNNAKVEFVNMSSTGNVSADGYTFTMGRGIVNTGNGGEIRGCTSDKNCVNTVKIESGKYSSLRNFTNGLSANRNCNQLMILGCDYDRAKNDNSKLSITGSMYVAGTSLNLNRSSNSLYVRGIIKSGDFLSDVAINNSYTGAGGTQSYYFSVGNSNTQNAGRRYLVMEGGIIKGIAGGMDESNNQAVTARAFDLRVRGTAQIDGVVYGAAEYANGRGIRTMVFTGGTIKGWIAGGANGTQNTNGALTGATYVYIGGKAKVDSDGSTRVLNRAIGGNVFGAGCGYSASSTSGQILTYNTNVVVADESYVERGVYGGGSYGYTTNTSNIYVLGGHVGGKNGGVSGTSYSASISGGVFGGACQNQGGTINITMSDGLVEGGIYGGSNVTGTISANVTMNINGGQVGTTSQTANIHGGGYGSNTRVSGNVDLTLGSQNQTTPGVTVYGDVYGGSALGYVNGTAATNTYHTRLWSSYCYREWWYS